MSPPFAVHKQDRTMVVRLEIDEEAYGGLLRPHLAGWHGWHGCHVLSMPRSSLLSGQGERQVLTYPRNPTHTTPRPNVCLSGIRSVRHGLRVNIHSATFFVYTNVTFVDGFELSHFHQKPQAKCRWLRKLFEWWNQI